MISYDVVVVGAGVEGSATAYTLAKNGQRVLLLEQFPLPHTRGSSHGQSRITRVAYASDDHYAIMMKESHMLWRKLERESNTSIFENCGYLSAGTPDDPFIKDTITSLRTHGVKHDVISHSELQIKYPMINVPAEAIGVLDHSGGILKANKALYAFQEVFKRHGGTINDGEQVIQIIPGDVITVKTSKSTYQALHVVITVGPWAHKFLSSLGLHLPMKVVRISVHYWKEKWSGQYSMQKFPTFMYGKVYAMPCFEYPGHVKACLHDGPEIDPDDRDAVNTNDVTEAVRKYVSEHLPGLETVPSVTETCIYTMTPDRQFILDNHPEWKNIIIGAGFSGHGYKLAPIVGKVLTELVLNKEPSYDLSRCRIRRFLPPKHQL
ncbi:peroxisomal sarcosine oxidase-like [Saccostrea echinata]|uniref:peroxisomal sarcosine oxidase-like n=1 Tax=Saccostrea echinata TaxID=191078 RepID=UPI002A83A684|nr:peroxisomal sarcosine oxidase-like [Saccostrea echinata]